MKKSLVLAGLVAMTGLTACGREEPAPVVPAPAPTTAPAAAPSAPAEPPAAAPAAPAEAPAAAPATPAEQQSAPANQNAPAGSTTR